MQTAVTPFVSVEVVGAEACGQAVVLLALGNLPAFAFRG